MPGRSGDAVRLRDVVLAGARRLPDVPGQARCLPEVLGGNGERARSIGTWLERNARRFARSPAILFEDQRITWRSLNRRVNRWSHELAARGVRPGEPVAVLVENSPETIVAVAALAKLGAIAALLNTQQRGRVLRHSLEVGGARRCIVGPGLEEAAGAVQWWTVGELEESAQARPAWDPESTRRVRLEDPAFYIYTSGTTGLPKASVMTHLRWTRAAAVYGLGILQLSPDDVVYVPLPLFHNMALTVAWAGSCRTGAAMAIRQRFSASAFWDDCRRFGVTAFPYIGEIPRYLLAQPPRPDDDRHSVRRIVGVGMRPELWSEFGRRFGIDAIFEHYAASEANTMFVNLLGIERSIGFCITPHALVRYDAEAGAPVRDRRGRLVKVRRGEPGLLLSRVTDRYRFDGYTDAEASADKLIRDPFGRGDVYVDTGDLLKKVGWGHAVFVDRLGDTFRWKSENVSTAQVEAILGAQPGVASCTVYGVEVAGHPGRAGMASVIPGAGFDAAALLAHARQELPSPAVPVFLRLREALETTGTFKHRKVELQREGFDPSVIDDPLFVALPGEPAWTPVDGDVFGAITRGDCRI